MIYQLNYNPFSDFWQNCQLNNVFSVLISVEPSYRHAAYLNDYSYYISENSIDNYSSARFLNLDYIGGIKKYIEDILIYKKVLDQDNRWSKVINIEKYYFNNNERFIEEIQEKIKNGQVISVGVNLFYWIKGSISYNQYHYNHYALITGYDDDKLQYNTFDDDLFGYKSHMIPEEQFRIAFLNSDCKEPPAYLISVCEDIQPYKLSVYDVTTGARRVMDSISKLNTDNIWGICAAPNKFGEAVDNCVINANRIVNRHQGNKLLFESLYSLGVVKNTDIIGKYICTENELIEGWIEVKNLITLCKFSEKNCLPLEKLYELNKRLFDKEFSLWYNVVDVLYNL